MEFLQLSGLFVLVMSLDFGVGKKWDQIPSLWPNATVPFKVSKSICKKLENCQRIPMTNPPDVRADTKKILETSMKEIEAVSCIKFAPRKDEQDFLEISAGLDCGTVTGHQGQAQLMVLQIPFCLEKKKLLRQLLHTLGLPNEQMRPDRDDHIQVNWDNIATLDMPFFAKQNTTDLPLQELPYDYSSVLHPDAHYHARNSSIPTLIPLQDGAVLGKSNGLSPMDVIKLNILYC